MIEARLVFERQTGVRERETQMLPTTDHREAIAQLARHLARRADLRGAPRCRVRVERGGTLRDEPALRDALRTALAGRSDAADES